MSVPTLSSPDTTTAGFRVHDTSTYFLDNGNFTPVPQFELLLGAIGFVFVLVIILFGILYKRRGTKS